jgi:hypothetical protein
MFAVHIFDVKAIENKKNIENIVVSADIASVLIDLDSNDFPLLSEITFIDHELFNGDDLTKVINELLKLELNTTDLYQKEFLEEIIRLVDLAKKMNLWILFNPFYEY